METIGNSLPETNKKKNNERKKNQQKFSSCLLYESPQPKTLNGGFILALELHSVYKF